MAQISENDKSRSRSFGDSSRLTNWILDSGETCHIIPQVSDCIPGSLEDTDKYIEFADGNHVTARQKVQVQIKMCEDNRDTFIVKLHNVLLAIDLCDRLFSIITLMNSVYICLCHKRFCMIYFRGKEKNEVTLPYSAQQKHAFWGGIKKFSKSKKIASRKKVALEILHHRLGHRSTISLMGGDNVNFWSHIELGIYPDPFCTSCKISSIKKG